MVASPVCQQCQSLLMTHGIPRDKLLSKHIHPAQESQLDEKSEEIQITEDQRVRLSHPLPKPLKMDGHFAPMQTRAVVVAEVVSLVHKVHLIHDGNRIREIIIGPLRVTESVLNPCGDGINEIHAENGNQNKEYPDSPVVNKDGRAVGVKAGPPSQHPPTVFLVTVGPEVGEGSEPQNRPDVVRDIP